MAFNHSLQTRRLSSFTTECHRDTTQVSLPLSSLSYLFLSHSSIDTGICIEDVIQTLIDLQLAHTGNSTTDIHLKQSEMRQRRRHDNNNNNLDPSSILVINSDVLRTALNRSSMGNSSSQNNSNLFDPAYLRLNTRR